MNVTVTKDDGTTHTKYVSCETHRFLTEDFLSKFEFEPDHEQIRAKETAQTVLEWYDIIPAELEKAYRNSNGTNETTKGLGTRSHGQNNQLNIAAALKAVENMITQAGKVQVGDPTGQIKPDTPDGVTRIYIASEES